MNRATRGASPLRGRYLATNRGLRAILAASDLFLAPLRQRRTAAIARPRRVLLCINGHLGDAVIATGAIAALSSALPDAEIGVVLPSWSRPVLEGDSRIRYRHVVDHWHSRRSGGLVARWLRYLRSRRRAIQEIRRLSYDAAVDLYDYFPNAALLLWSARIPTRIGFDAAGFSAFYTHAVKWPNDDRHTAERQLLLLRVLVPSLDPASGPGLELPAAPPEVAARVEGLLASRGLRSRSFVVLHPGAGSRAKMIPDTHWRALAERLLNLGHTLVFTGRGERERQEVGIIRDGLPHCVDLCDELDWAEYVEVVRLAHALVSVDTVAGHVAAAVGTPSITFWTSPSKPSHWRPLSASSVVLEGNPGDSMDEFLASFILSPGSSPGEPSVIENSRKD